jgi:protein-disulfide isomerase
MSQKKVFKFAVIIIVILVLSAVGLYAFKPAWFSPPSTEHAAATKAVTIDTIDQPTMGDVNAPIKIVAFEDLKCFNCRLFDTELLPWVIKNYVNTGQASYTMISVAFLPNSMQAAVAARCVYQQEPKAFFSYVDTLYQNQGAESENWANTAKLLQWAHDIKGLDQDAFSTCLLSGNNTNKIIKNTQYGMDVMGGQLATPSIYINGILVRPLTQDRIEAIIKSVSS